MAGFGHETMLPKKPLSYSLGMAGRHSGSFALPPKPRALLLSRGLKEQRCSKEEAHCLNAVCYRPSDEAPGNILARGISQFFSYFLMMNMKIFNIVLLGDICANNTENSIILPTVN